LGITFAEPKIEINRVREWKDKVIDRLANGLVELVKRRGILFVQGRAVFEDSNHVRLQAAGTGHIKFKHCIIATGSLTRRTAGVEFKPGGRIMGSTGALEFADIPKRLLVVGGGYVGLETGSIYASMGSKVILVEAAERLMRGVDSDLVRPLLARLDGLFESIHYHTKVAGLKEDPDGVEVAFEGEIDDKSKRFDRVLVAVGRSPNSTGIGLEKTKVKVDERGFIQVNEQRRTADEKIFAVGDVVGGAMLAHKAMHEGKVAAEVIAGLPSAFDFRVVPAVVYTDPQIAVCGLGEDQARERNIKVKISRFPWTASGRAVSMGVAKGLTKLVIDPETQRVLGMGIVGREAGEMISEGVLAIEMGALAEDVALSMHPHPTLAEAEEEAAEAFLGSSTHILPQKK
jgi:dihydrolipoamide dehydrogenase